MLLQGLKKYPKILSNLEKSRKTAKTGRKSKARKLFLPRARGLRPISRYMALKRPFRPSRDFRYILTSWDTLEVTQWGKMGGTAAMNISTFFEPSNYKSLNKRCSSTWIAGCDYQCQFTVNSARFDRKNVTNSYILTKFWQKNPKKSPKFLSHRVPLCRKTSDFTSTTHHHQSRKAIYVLKVVFWPIEWS